MDRCIVSAVSGLSLTIRRSAAEALGRRGVPGNRRPPCQKPVYGSLAEPPYGL
jgi:hypothetical protein